MQELAYEKAKMAVEDDECNVEEIYHGIGFLYYSDIIDHDQYDSLMKLFDEKHPGYREEAIYE